MRCHVTKVELDSSINVNDHVTVQRSCLFKIQSRVELSWEVLVASSGMGLGRERLLAGFCQVPIKKAARECWRNGLVYSFGQTLPSSVTNQHLLTLTAPSRASLHAANPTSLPQNVAFLQFPPHPSVMQSSTNLCPSDTRTCVFLESYITSMTWWWVVMQETSVA